MVNKTPTVAELRELSLRLPENIPYVKMLVLFGSRARGDIHANSDWDFAVICDENQRLDYVKDNPFLWFELPAKVGEILQINSDIIDVVELDHCSPLMGYHVARDAKVLYESKPESFLRFQCKAWKIYADTAKFRKAERESIKLWLNKRGL
ncbi:hypothetical protein NIES4071_33070 [Calothrix sp. NIES-4071]|nr:hypothetical protein NIES4071_33070 [Calothrix sp. NIES-4071]BAZ57627.1 hypothetical protein NIES4105_33010 [Calothrix sp. NIES-4105]